MFEDNINQLKTIKALKLIISFLFVISIILIAILVYYWLV